MTRTWHPIGLVDAGLTAIFRLLGHCEHAHTYRERRPRTINGHEIPDVPHYVCEACGYAAPALSRDSVEEHEWAQEAGAPQLPTARPARASVLPMRGRR